MHALCATKRRSSERTEIRLVLSTFKHYKYFLDISLMTTPIDLGCRTNIMNHESIHSSFSQEQRDEKPPPPFLSKKHDLSLLQPNTSALTSILSRGLAPAGVRGSENAECGTLFPTPSTVSEHFRNSLSSSSMPDQYFHC